MSGTGNCYGNAPMESFWHSLKVEETHEQNFTTRAAAKHCVFAYIEGDRCAPKGSPLGGQHDAHAFTLGLQIAGTT